MVAPPHPSDPAAPAHVLVVDDDDLMAMAIADLVRSQGHRVTVTHGWTEALRAFTAGDIDLVLMDAIMPGVDGFKLTKLLRARSASYVPIVFLTALSDRHAREQGMASGADDFLVKPIDPIELRVRVSAMLRIRTLTRELETRSRTLAKLASVDGLTGVGNRRSFDDALPRELAAAQTKGECLSLLLMDIDHFKRVNDTFGHTVGDALLSSFGVLLTEVGRSHDLVYRYGGEEFALIARGLGCEEGVNLGERIRSGFALRSDHATVCGAQTLSIGVCSTEQFSRVADPQSMIAGADAALYRAKALGRNCVCRFDARLDARVA